MVKKTTNFGEHFTLDGYGGSLKELGSERMVKKCLNELPRLLHMKKLAKPQILRASEISAKDPGGWSGYVIITESHISIHTFPLRGFLSMDAYSCKCGMDTKLITDYFKEKFSLKKVETNFFKRGTFYPMNNINCHEK